MAMPKNKQITLRRGDACQVTLPDGRVLEISSSGKVDLIATNGNVIVFSLPDIEYGETEVGLISSLIGDTLAK